eukprot:GEMP01103370.1.p2 GENE.GEMP01103370.1~~GEMP01103370.1.p2  ORF type:complete len:105 (-),score=2.79 GEMP01103370.1:11-325(-)
MEFTTCFGLHFQATRLYREALSDRPICTLTGAAIRACHPPWAVAAFKLDLDGMGRRAGPSETQHPSCPKTSRLCAGLFPVQSPLLRESLLVSFPPLINMLKFGG